MSTDLAIVIPVGPGDNAWRDLLPQLDAVGARETAVVLARRDDTAPERVPPDVTLLLSPPGRALQLNAGAARTRAQWLWFLHADSTVVPSTISALHRFIDRDEAAIGYFDLRFMDDGPLLMSLNAWGAQIRSRLFDLPFGDQGFVMPRRVYDAIGGFNPYISGGEDHAAVWAARSIGIPLKPLRAPIYTSARKYAQRGWWATTREHLRLTVEQARRFSRQESMP